MKIGRYGTLKVVNSLPILYKRTNLMIASISL